MFVDESGAVWLNSLNVADSLLRLERRVDEQHLVIAELRSDLTAVHAQLAMQQYEIDALKRTNHTLANTLLHQAAFLARTDDSIALTLIQVQQLEQHMYMQDAQMADVSASLAGNATLLLRTQTDMWRQRESLTALEDDSVIATLVNTTILHSTLLTELQQTLSNTSTALDQLQMDTADRSLAAALNDTILYGSLSALRQRMYEAMEDLQASLQGNATSLLYTQQYVRVLQINQNATTVIVDALSTHVDQLQHWAEGAFANDANILARLLALEGLTGITLLANTTILHSIQIAQLQALLTPAVSASQQAQSNITQLQQAVSSLSSGAQAQLAVQSNQTTQLASLINQVTSTSSSISSMLAALTWHKVGDAWCAANNVTLLQGWVNYAANPRPFRFSKDAFGVVRLGGLVSLPSGSNYTADAAVVTLPAGYRPSQQVWLPADSLMKFGELTVLETGDVKLRVAYQSWFSFDGVQWPTS